MGGAEILVPISFFVMAGLVFIARSEIGKAIAHSIRMTANRGAGGVEADQLRAEIAEVRAELDGVRQELAETHERMEFVERVLARGRTPEQLPGG